MTQKTKPERSQKKRTTPQRLDALEEAVARFEQLFMARSRTNIDYLVAMHRGMEQQMRQMEHQIQVVNQWFEEYPEIKAQWEQWNEQMTEELEKDNEAARLELINRARMERKKQAGE